MRKPLTDQERHQMTVLAKRAAYFKYLRNNKDATREAAWRFARRFWRTDEFIRTAARCMTIIQVIAESEAAPNN